MVKCLSLLMIPRYLDASRGMDSNKLQKDLDTIIDRANKWQINFNVSKCEVMHVGRTNTKRSYYMRLLEEVDPEKDLGIIISSDLKCSQQCLFS